MNKKILGIFIVILLITIFFQMQPITSKQTKDKSNFDSFFDVYWEVGDFGIGTTITFQYIGDKIAENIEWTFNASGGVIFFGDGVRSRIPTSMEPSDIKEIYLKPIPILSNADGQSPIGFGSIKMKVTVQGTVGSTLVTGSSTKDAFLLGPFILLSK